MFAFGEAAGGVADAGGCGADHVGDGVAVHEKVKERHDDHEVADVEGGGGGVAACVCVDDVAVDEFGEVVEVSGLFDV